MCYVAHCPNLVSDHVFNVVYNMWLIPAERILFGARTHM